MFTLSTLLIGLALTPKPTPTVKLKALYFGTQPIQVGMKNNQGEIVPRLIYSHTFSPYWDINCPDNRITFYQPEPTAGESIHWLPWISAPLPSSGEYFLAIISEAPRPTTLHLLADQNYLEEGGFFHVFNLSPATIALDFPGQKKLLARGQRTQFRPAVKTATYGQGQLALMDEAQATMFSNGVRWLQMEDVRSFWFVLPPSHDGATFILKNIEDRIFAP